MQLPGEFSPFIEKKIGFLLSGRGGPPPTPLVVRPLKTTFSSQFSESENKHL